MNAMTTSWKPASLNDDLPLYRAIAEALAGDISSGRLRPGQRLPSQRRLAALIGVDLSTVTRALAECQRRGLIQCTVGRGTFVTADGGAPLALARVEQASRAPLIEMGHVLPLYDQEKTGRDAIRRFLPALDLERCLRYTDPEGMRRHREAGAAWVKRAGVAVRPENVLVTAGSQNAIACCLLALFKPGDSIAVDELTFTGLKAIARMQDIRLIPVEMDDHGMLPDALERACRREHPRGLYLMPDFQNPTTSALPEDRRSEIARLIELHDLIFIEDDAYGHTVGRHTALSARVPERGIYLGGTSKLFGAGLRISFVACPARFVAQMGGAVLGTVWMASPLNAELMTRIITGGHAERIITAKRAEARARTVMAQRKLAPYRLHARESGFSAWLALPSGWTGRDFELSARDVGVRVFAAERFAIGGRAAPAAARISLTGPETREELSHGLDILADVLARGRVSSSAIL